MIDLSRYRKAVTAVVGATLIIVAAFFEGNEDLEKVVQTVLAILTAVGVYGISNER